MDEETRREMELLQAEDAEFLRGMDELPTDESDLDSDVDLAEFESTDEEAEDDENDEVAENTLRNQELAIASDEEEEEDEEIEEEEENEDASEAESDQQSDEEDDEDAKSADVVVEEDIYGRPVVKPASAAAPSAYIPPHLRRKMQEEAEKAAAAASGTNAKALLSSKMDEQALRELARRINGQLNRISETNMEPIALALEALYRENVRSAVNEILHEKVMQTACHPRQVMTSLIKVCSALIAALYHSVGTEVGGFFIEKIVKQLTNSIEAFKAQEAANSGKNVASADDEDDPSSTSKESVNLVLFVSMLYNFGVVHCTLVYDLFRSLVSSFSGLEIELIHHLLKASGPQLRADDADALREMIALVQQQVAQAQATNSQPHERIRFILDLIYDLKKPSSKQKKAAGSAALDLTSLKKWLGRVKSRCGNANNPLRVSLHELLHADEDGRWWIVGGTWVGYQNSKPTGDAEDDDANADKKQQQSEEARLMRLAEKQRMNTDVRKRIFVAIMGATDCLDAYERLLQLNLKEKQEREIVRVLLHCCGQEKKFNKYYLVLADKLCEMDQRYKFTFQLAYWDVFKQIETLKPRRLYNQSQMLAGLVTSGSLSLSCLKVLDFTQLEEKAVLFLRVVLEKILKLESEMEMAKVFQRLLQTKKAQLTIDGLAVFMHQHMASFRGEQDAATRTLLKKRAKSARSLLDQLAKSAAAAEHLESFK